MLLYAGAAPGRIGRLVVVGVGLIGASFATALRSGGLVEEIVGVGRSRANLDVAIRENIIDRDAGLAEAVEGADLVFLAVPMAAMPKVLAELGGLSFPSHCVLTDAGSVKAPVLAAAKKHLKKRCRRFVPGHPVAGSEQHGAAAADAGLYRGRRVVLTPNDHTDNDALDLVGSLWQACGAEVLVMRAGRHDKALAAVSHAPHAIAFSLVSELAERPDAEGLLRLAGTGFRDFSRIAASSAEVWRDICLANQEPLLDELIAFRDRLDVLLELLRKGDGDGLGEFFNRAADFRRRYVDS